MLRRGEGFWLASTDWGTAVLYNGLGRYDDALAAAERAADDPHGLGTPMWLLAELVEAAVRSGQPERAAGPLAQLAEIAEATGTDWALGFHARSRALLSDGATAERLYREAVERLGRTRIRVAHARAHLLYGEWLRRESRRVDAREQLRAAHEMLADMGMEAFAERARRELAGHRRDGAQAHGRDARRADAAGGADRAAWRPTGARTRRSARSCSSARARSSGTCARCSESSASAPAGSSARRCRTASQRPCPSRRVRIRHLSRRP